MAIRKQRNSQHPLRVKFADYLATLDDDSLLARVGRERHKAMRAGLMGKSRYIPPIIERDAQGAIANAYTVTELQADDDRAFTEFRRSHGSGKVKEG